ncbi:MAG: hypothetical protein V4692_03085 [Bdellovibrionota bacterium]
MLHAKVLFIALSLMTITAEAQVRIKRTPISSQILSSEKVPLHLYKAALECQDMMPDHGFGKRPGRVSIVMEKTLDRSLRINVTDYMTVIIPDEVTCASLSTQIEREIGTIIVNRVVTEEIHDNGNGKIVYLYGELQAEIPVLVGGVNLVVTGEQRFFERAAQRPMPVSQEYTLKLHPQSASTGLECKRLHFSEIATLQMHGVGGYERLNVNRVERQFDNGLECEDLRARLLVRFQGEDPGNWGTILPVTRKVDRRLRYILDNQGDPTCQRIEMEQLQVDLGDVKLFGAKSFVIGNEPLELCQK